MRGVHALTGALVVAGLTTWLGAQAQVLRHHARADVGPAAPDGALAVSRPTADARGATQALAWLADLGTADERRREAWQRDNFVCLNVIDTATGMPVGRTHVLVTLAERRVAITGVYEPLTGARRSDGLRVEPAVAAVRRLAGELGQDVDALVVLAHMDRLAAADILRQVDRVAAVVVPARGANDAEAVPIAHGILVQSPDAPNVVGEFDLQRSHNALVALAAEADTAPAPRRNPVRQADLARWIGKPPAPVSPDHGAATSYQPGVVAAVSAEAANRALNLRAHAFTIQSRYAKQQAPAGRAFLVADVEWTNDIPMQYAFGNEVPVAFQIEDFGEILFAVVDGARLGRFDATLSELPGGLIERQPFLLPHLGSQRRGTVVFDIPAQACTTLDLRFYDFTHGHIAVPLLRRDAQPATALAAARNELMEVSVFAAHRDGDRVFVDLRARSIWPLEVDATAFDPAAKPGARMQTPTLGRWQDVQDTVLLHVDGGEEGLRPWRPADTLLLPDIAVGNGVVFAVPAAAKNLELRITYPMMSVPGRGEPLQPAELRIPLGPHVVAGPVPGDSLDAAPPVDSAPKTPPAADAPAGPPAGPPVARTEPSRPTAPVAKDPPAAPAQPRQPEPAPPPATEDAAPSPQAVSAAVLRGGEFLWRQLADKDPRALGKSLLWGHDEQLLITLALAHAGITEQTPQVGAFARELLAAIEPRAYMDVYQVSVAMMLVDQLGDPAFLPLLQSLARYLVEAQRDDGSWAYSELVEREQLAARDPRVLKVSGGRPLDGSPAVFTKLERQKPFSPISGDNSTTQFALLGLHAAAQNGIGIPAQTWQRANACVRARQNPDGGFSYHGARGEPSTGSMTAAGLSMLLLSERDERKAKAQPEAVRAEQWLDRQFDVANNPGSPTNVGYWRYGLERVGRLLGRERIGQHDWFARGAAHLLTNQKPDGSWEEPPAQPARDTSFALLFLTRATRPLRVELKRGGHGMLKTTMIAPPPTRVYVVLDASGSMLEQVGGQGKFQGAIAALEDLVARLPKGTEFALRVYGHRKRATEKGADEDSELLVPFAPLDAARVRRTLAGLRARGRTPLAFSMAKAREDIVKEFAPTTLVLLTDGGEDPQSRRDPRREAAELQRAGVTLFVVGFDIRRDDWNQQLREVATRGAGQYLAAADGNELRARVLDAVLGLPGGFRVFDADGKQVAEGAFGDTLRLPEGEYELRTELSGREVKTGFWVNTEATTQVVFDVVNARKL